MPMPAKGRSDYFAEGQWNTICFECGRKFKSGVMRRHWRGYYVCPEHWEARHPQDFVKAVVEHPAPPWVQPPPEESFIFFCTPNDINCIPGLAVPGCAIPDFISAGFDYALANPVCEPLILGYTSYIAPSATIIVCGYVALTDWLEIDGNLRIQ